MLTRDKGKRWRERKEKEYGKKNWQSVREKTDS